MTDAVFNSTPMDCWITLPAIWSDEAKELTLQAANNAGFGKRDGDELHTIAEPEAAAIAVLREYTSPVMMTPTLVRTLNAGDNCMEFWH